MHSNLTEIFRPPLSPRPVALPFFACTVSAGFPSPADDHLDRSLNLQDFLIEHPTASFCVRLKGESMKGAGLFDGDILVVDRSLQARHGDIVVAVVDGDLTVKRLYRRGGVTELRPENPDFPVIACRDASECSIWGVVTGSVRKFR